MVKAKKVDVPMKGEEHLSSRSRALFDMIEAKAREIVEETGSHSAVFFLVEPSKGDDKITLGVIQADMSSGEEKDAFMEKLRDVVASKGVEEYFSVIDGWSLPERVAKSLTKEELAVVRPSQHPDRESQLIISRYSKTEGMTMRMIAYRADKKGKVVFGKTSSSSGQLRNRFGVWHTEQVEMVMK
jgi:hypothetical protein